MKSPSSHVCNGPLLCAELNAVQWPINHHTYQLGQGQRPEQRSVWNRNCNHPHTNAPGRVFPLPSLSMEMQDWRPAGGNLACIWLSSGCMHSLMGHSHKASFHLQYSQMWIARTLLLTSGCHVSHCQSCMSALWQHVCAFSLSGRRLAVSSLSDP